MLDKTLTINKEARAFYHLFYDEEPNISLMDHLYQPVKEKDRNISLTDNKGIDLNHYDLKIISEVKHVIFDLSCNTGGMVIAMPFLLGLMKKDFHINSYNYYVKDLSQRHYRLDLNGKGVFGEDSDTYEGKYSFCVFTSRCSFSCSNTFPGAAKYNKAAIIIGKGSADGESGVDYFTTPSGFDLRCSSCMTEAFELEDGAFLENDKGITVDYEIGEQYWYSRALLNTKLDEIQNQ